MAATREELRPLALRALGSKMDALFNDSARRRTK
jgi:hypothetical protein